MAHISPLLGPRLHYVTAVWGEAYTRRFIDVVLPTHASPGNLGGLNNRPGDVYWLYTTPEDAAAIEASAVIKTVRDLVEVRVVSIEPMLSAGLDKYGVIAEVHRRVLDEVNQHRAAAVFLSPDAVFADGAFVRLRDLTLQGKRRVLVAGLRAEAEAWERSVREHVGADDDGVRAVSSEVAMRAALRHPHPWTEALRWDSECLHDTPSHLYVPVASPTPEAEREEETATSGEPSALLCRAFHLHPLLVWPRTLSGVFTRTVDGDLARAAGATPEEIHLVSDSAEIAAVELSDADAMPFVAETQKPGRAAAVAQWAIEHTDDAHRGYFTHAVRLHAGGVAEADWEQAESEAERVADAVLHQIEKQAPEAPPEEQLSSGVAAHSSDDGATKDCRLHFIVPVWGEAYIDRFLRWGLPSFLAPNNLPAVRGDTFAFDIVTDDAGVEQLQQHQTFRQLRELVRVRLLTPDHDTHRHGIPDDSLGYTRMTRYYNAAIHAAVEPDVAHVFLTPEGVFSDGMFPQLLRRFAEGYRAVVLPGFRVLEEEAIDAILERHLEPDGVALSAMPRDLVEWVLKHPHPITQAHTWKDGGPRLHPHYYFPVGDDGFVAHCFHAHPLAVWPEQAGTPIPPGQTLDHEYLQNAVPLHLVHLVTDTDEMCVIDIAQDGHLDDTFSAVPYGPDDIADFAVQWCNGYHRWQFAQGVRVHTAGIDERWEKAESEALARVAYVSGVLSRRLELPIYAESRAAQQRAAEEAAQWHARPWWLRQALRVERKQAALRRRVDEVGWLRAFAVRTRLRRAAYRVKNKLRPPVEVTEV